MKRIVLSLAIFLAVSAVPAFSQNGTRGEASRRVCNYVSRVERPRKVHEFRSTAEAEAAVERILKYAGLPRNFVVQPGEVENAAAGIDGNQRRFIYYNPAFIARLKELAKTDWVAYSILAHEIGHHLLAHHLEDDVEHTLQDEVKINRRQELEADKFSGHILRYMGADEREAQAAVNAYADEAATSTHPSKESRLAAIRDGWNEADDIIKGFAAGASQPPPPQPAPQAPPRPAPQTPSRPAPQASPRSAPTAYRISTDNTSRKVAQRWWQWSVFIDAPAEVLDQISCVEYTLHPTFTPRVYLVCERGTVPAFELRGEGDGTFRIQIRVLTRDNRPPHELFHDLKFR